MNEYRVYYRDSAESTGFGSVVYSAKSRMDAYNAAVSDGYTVRFVEFVSAFV